MSRVDEAMRRAAEQAADSSAITPAGLTPIAGDDPAVLAREPFPLEMPDRRPRSTERSSMLSPVAPAAEPHADATPAAAASPRLFERFDASVSEKLVIDARMAPQSREQYRRLAGVLHDAQEGRGLKVVMMASALSGEGKTLTATNLALTLSGSYRRRVLLIDADLRRPTLQNVFRINAASGGLSDALDPAIQSNLIVRQVSPTLSVLPAGRPTADPMAALISDRMRRLIEESRETFEWVLIDTPPLGLLPDASLLASMVDGVVLVIKAESTPFDFVKKAADSVGRSRILGVLLNRATVKPTSSYSGYYDDYYAHPTEPQAAG